MTAATATEVPTKQIPWWLPLVSGILNIIIGVLLLTTPVKTTYALVLVLGFFWIFSGIATLIGMFIDSTQWFWKLLIGGISLLAGFTIVRYPIISTFEIPQILVLLLGIQGLILGVVGLVMAFKGGGWGMGILSALGILFGIVLLANWSSPGMGLTLVWVAAIFALVGGISQIVQAFRIKSAE